MAETETEINIRAGYGYDPETGETWAPDRYDRVAPPGRQQSTAGPMFGGIWR